MRVLKEVRQYLDNYHLKAGIFHFYRGEYGPAAGFFTRALEEDELSAADRRASEYYLVQTHIGAAREHIEEGDPERAIGEYESAIATMPGYADVHVKLASALATLGRREDAIKHYREALAINSEYARAWRELGHLLLDAERADEAREAFRSAIEAQRIKTDRSCARAESALDAGRIDEARDLYKDLFHENVEEFRGHFEQALLLLRHEKWEDATVELRTCIELCPRFADVYNYLGVALAEQEELAEACVAFEKSVDLNADYIVAWLNLAYTRFASGDENAASDALREVLRREPDNAPALHLESTLTPGSEPADEPRAGVQED